MKQEYELIADSLFSLPWIYFEHDYTCLPDEEPSVFLCHLIEKSKEISVLE